VKRFRSADAPRRDGRLNHFCTDGAKPQTGSRSSASSEAKDSARGSARHRLLQHAEGTSAANGEARVASRGDSERSTRTSTTRQATGTVLLAAPVARPRQLTQTHERIRPRESRGRANGGTRRTPRLRPLVPANLRRSHPSHLREAKSPRQEHARRERRTPTRADRRRERKTQKPNRLILDRPTHRAPFVCVLRS